MKNKIPQIQPTIANPLCRLASLEKREINRRAKLETWDAIEASDKKLESILRIRWEIGQKERNRI
jgi:hypothetical protein